MNPDTRHELSLVAGILITAVIIGTAVAILPTLGRTDPDPAEEAAAAQFYKARAMEEEDPAKAMEMYAAIPPAVKEWHTRAAIQIGRLQAEEARKPPKPSPKELADYEALLQFWRENAGHYPELIRRGEEFVSAHPRGEKRPEIERRIAHAREGLAEFRKSKAETTILAVDKLLARDQFGAAILEIENQAPELRTDLNVWPQLAAKRDSVLALARRHYLKQVEESDKLVGQNLRDDARRLWLACIRSYGDGKVPDLADLHRAAELRLGEIKP